MISKNISKLPKAVVEVQVTMPWAEVEPKWNEILAKLAAEVEMPGFRKGMAPLNVVEPQISSKVYDELLKVVMPQALIEALQGTEIVPIDYPQYTSISFQKGQDLKFTAKVTEKPVVKVGDYKSVKVAKPEKKQVGSEEVDKVVNDLYGRWKQRQGSVNQPIGESVNRESKNPTVEQSNNSASGASGSLSFEQPDETASQPASESANLESNNATIQQSNNDVPDDEFAMAVGATSLEDLKSKIKTDLENEANYNGELDFEEAILQAIEKITEVEIPEILVQDELNRMLLSLQRNVSDRGLLLEEYLKGQNKTVDKLKAEWREQAERNTRMELGLSEVAKAEGVAISDEELQSEIDKIQDAKVKAQFAAEEPKMHLRHALRQTKTLNLLKTIVG